MGRSSIEQQKRSRDPIFGSFEEKKIYYTFEFGVNSRTEGGELSNRALPETTPVCFESERGITRTN